MYVTLIPWRREKVKFMRHYFVTSQLPLFSIKSTSFRLNLYYYILEIQNSFDIPNSSLISLVMIENV